MGPLVLGTIWDRDLLGWWEPLVVGNSCDVDLWWWWPLVMGTPCDEDILRYRPLEMRIFWDGDLMGPLGQFSQQTFLKIKAQSERQDRIGPTLQPLSPTFSRVRFTKKRWCIFRPPPPPLALRVYNVYRVSAWGISWVYYSVLLAVLYNYTCIWPLPGCIFCSLL